MGGHHLCDKHALAMPHELWPLRQLDVFRTRARHVRISAAEYVHSAGCCTLRGADLARRRDWLRRKQTKVEKALSLLFWAFRCA